MDRRLFLEGLPVHIESCDNLQFLATVAGETDIHCYGYAENERAAVADLLESIFSTLVEYEAMGEEHLGPALVKEYREMRRRVYGPVP